jgi:hypothetical protein
MFRNGNGTEYLTITGSSNSELQKKKVLGEKKTFELKSGVETSQATGALPHVNLQHEVNLRCCLRCSPRPPVAHSGGGRRTDRPMLRSNHGATCCLHSMRPPPLSFHLVSFSPCLISPPTCIMQASLSSTNPHACGCDVTVTPLFL